MDDGSAWSEYYVLDGDTVSAVMVDADGPGLGGTAPTLARKFVAGPIVDQVLASYASESAQSANTFYLADHQGSTRLTISTIGTSLSADVESVWDYDSYGNVSSAKTAGGVDLTTADRDAVRFTYTGRSHDSAADVPKDLKCTVRREVRRPNSGRLVALDGTRPYRLKRVNRDGPIGHEGTLDQDALLGEVGLEIGDRDLVETAAGSGRRHHRGGARGLSGRDATANRAEHVPGPFVGGDAPAGGQQVARVNPTQAVDPNGEDRAGFTPLAGRADCRVAPGVHVRVAHRRPPDEAAAHAEARHHRRHGKPYVLIGVLGTHPGSRICWIAGLLSFLKT